MTLAGLPPLLETVPASVGSIQTTRPLGKLATTGLFGTLGGVSTSKWASTSVAALRTHGPSMAMALVVERATDDTLSSSM